MHILAAGVDLLAHSCADRRQFRCRCLQFLEILLVHFLLSADPHFFGRVRQRVVLDGFFLLVVVIVALDVRRLVITGSG